MYGLLLESVQFYLKEKYGDEIWQEIRQRAGVAQCAFVTHQIYSDDLMQKIAEAAEQTGTLHKNNMTKQDYMQFFGACFVKFFSHYGYDKIVRISGRYLRDFLIGIDNLHEHMRFGYPKLKSPTFYCDEETAYGLTLHYVSKRMGFTHYVIGQVEEIARLFYSTNVAIKVLDEKPSSVGQTHVTYRLIFDNSVYKSLQSESLSVRSDRFMANDVLLELFPFSFVISPELVIDMAAECVLTSLGDEIVGRRVSDIFTLRRPLTNFTWENVSTSMLSFNMSYQYHTPFHIFFIKK